MNTKNNNKSKESIKNIQKAVCKLLQIVGHEKLTIKQICDEAKVNRTTFYAHFDTIEDVLYEICEEHIIKAYEIFLNRNIPYQQRIKQTMDVLMENAEFFAYVFEHVHNLEIKILNMVESCCDDANNEQNPEQAKLSLAFIISGFVGVGKIYFTNEKYKNKMTPEQFSEILCGTINQANPYFIIK